MTDHPPLPAAPPRPAIDLDLYCPKCHYPPGHLTSDRCPECGLPLDFLDAAESRVPWVRKRGVGKIWGYLATTLIIVSLPSRIWREFYRPISVNLSWRYLWVTVFLTVFGVAALETHALFQPDWLPLQYQPAIQRVGSATDNNLFADTLIGDRAVAIGWIPVLGALVGLGLGIAIAVFIFAAMPTAFLGVRTLPTELQIRAIALRNYTSSALLVVLLAMFAAYLWTVLDYVSNDSLDGNYLLLHGIAIGLALLFLWIQQARLTYFLHRGGSAVITTAFALPFLSLGLGLAASVRQTARVPLPQHPPGGATAQMLCWASRELSG
ncbi:MAG: hypothetical protein AB7N71_01705 [Phycisphaerae bacterium]